MNLPETEIGGRIHFSFNAHRDYVTFLQYSTYERKCNENNDEKKENVLSNST